MRRDKAGWLDRERGLAGPGYNRWLVIPAALAIHLCIGTTYAFSVFLQPLSHALGVASPIACPSESGFWQALVQTGCDWRVSDIGWVYSLFFVMLGSSAAIWGGWVERVGPRKAGMVAALCWSGGHVLAALGVRTHQLWLMLLGYGGVGGIGLGLGYVLPISTLMRWFPDRRGIAGGLAVMGFGGGAMIGAPLAELLMGRFRSPASVGVWQTLLVLAAINLMAMSAGALCLRQKQVDVRRPAGSVGYAAAMRTRQFWLLWIVLCLNTSVGIGVLGWAALMLQEIFGGRLIGIGAVPYEALTAEQRVSLGMATAGFTGLLSVFNVAGRLWWAWLSDRLGRKRVYGGMLCIGIALYGAAPAVVRSGQAGLFVAGVCVAISLFGGGFALLPAYVADLFGPGNVSAIQGRLLTAWSAAGVLGPALIGALRGAALREGQTVQAAYTTALYTMAVLLCVALVANLLVRRLPAGRFTAAVAGGEPATGPVLEMRLVAAWLSVGVPMAWGLWMTASRVWPFLATGLR